MRAHGPTGRCAEENAAGGIKFPGPIVRPVRSLGRSPPYRETRYVPRERMIGGARRLGGVVGSRVFDND